MDGKVEDEVGQVLARSSRITEKSKAFHSALLRLLQGADDVWRITTAGQNNQNVAPPGLRRELCRKDFVVPEIVAETGQDRNIRGKSRHLHAFATRLGNRIKEIVCPVDGIGRAAAVATDKDSSAVAPRQGQLIR